MAYIERDIFINNELIPLVKTLDLCHPKQKKGVLMAISKLKEAPTADMVEVKHGKWIEDGYCDISYVCSVCGAEAQYTSRFKETFDYDWEENLQSTGYEEIKEYIRTPYCSHCGAKMDGKDGE